MLCSLCSLRSSSCVTVFAGRWLMSFWTGTAKIHELYTAACGLYVCWLSIRAVTVLLAWMPQGRRVILLKVQEWTLMVQNITRIGDMVGTAPVRTPGRHLSTCKIFLVPKQTYRSLGVYPALSFSVFCKAAVFCMWSNHISVNSTGHENLVCLNGKATWKRDSRPVVVNSASTFSDFTLC